jgi:DNA-directed RNA polymerase subunit beta'
MTSLERRQMLTEEEYLDVLEEHIGDEFEAKMGAEAILDLLKGIELAIRN